MPHQQEARIEVNLLSASSCSAKYIILERRNFYFIYAKSTHISFSYLEKIRTLNANKNIKYAIVFELAFSAKANDLIPSE